MTIQHYLDKINQRYKTGISREHSYRGDLQTLLENLTTDILVTNEPARIKCGAPDYVLTKKEIPVGYIEAKDIGDADLDGKKVNKAQFDRYKASLNNLIFTDYLDFHFYLDGELTVSIKIAEIIDGHIKPIPSNYDQFEALIKDFVTRVGQTIKSASKLSQMMAGKAKLLAQVITNALNSDEESAQNSTLREQMLAFKDVLLHDITVKGFADIYAQTIAYGMFAARLHDDTPDDFTRQEAANLIPKSNPFLRKLFQYISGYDIDTRIEWIVTALADIFRATNVGGLLRNFGEATQSQDPIIHFYEDFLAEYDPKLRKTRGVWYTPQPVVDFIVRAVDDVLKTEFNLPQGLADNSKTTIKVNTDQPDKRSSTGYRQVNKEIHKVQILDPATGTGTFLAQIITHIYKTRFANMQGAWNGYVEKDLIPRLNGFEILMASYAMAHLKLDLLLKETGYRSTSDQRFRVYLTNSLEEYHPDTGTLFAGWLSGEANEANHIKRDTPVMVVMGNPPYSGESANKGKWIMDLMDDYKKEPGGKEKLKERNPKWINDDYVKFMRYGQHFIEKNGEGVLAFINPHGFLDNPTFRGMRWNLLKTYDKIYTIDLHGNSKKKETAPDGGKDENVFDIQQGVSINIFIKTGKKKSNELGRVFHYDCYGKRNKKYRFLSENNLTEIPFVELPNKAPNYFMVQKDFEAEEKYKKGFSLDKVFLKNTVGIVTSRDGFVIADDRTTLGERIKSFFELPKSEILNKYDIRENKSWKIDDTKISARQFIDENLKEYSYRPFDNKTLYYHSDFIERNRIDVMKHFNDSPNIGLVFSRQSTSEIWTNIQISDKMIDNRYHFSYKGIPQQAPLYLYPESNDQEIHSNNRKRRPNLNQKIVQKFTDYLCIEFTPESEASTNTFAPIDVLDYIYAVLHSPTYRETYKEFLKIDFPRVPYPTDKKRFWQLVKLGGELRQIHLLESPEVENYITTYPENGNNTVERKLTKTSPGYEPTTATMGKVWINDAQYFDKVPLTAWEFYIGGYQPAQKWLKDRRGRELSYDDILHYQKIIVALSETDRIMGEIDGVRIIQVTF